MSDPVPQSLGHAIHTIPAPLPFRSPRWVNCYLIEDPDGLTMIDCGADWPEGRAALDRGFAELGFDPTSVHTLIVSHLHPDHVGLAPAITREWGPRLLMHRSAADLYRRYNDTSRLEKWLGMVASRHGVPDHLQETFGQIGPRPSFMPLIDPPDMVVDDGDTIPIGGQRRLDVIHTPGHEHTHICLRDSRTGILFSGDHVLPRITPVIMHDEDGDDVLGMYLRSLDRLIHLNLGLTYPAHGSLVERGSLRAEQIVLHHHRRLSGMEDVVRLGPATAWHVMERVFRPNLNSLEQRLALRETIAHLEHLRYAERLSLFEEAAVCFYRSA